jgi:hypothetical protein
MLTESFFIRGAQGSFLNGAFFERFGVHADARHNAFFGRFWEHIVVDKRDAALSLSVDVQRLRLNIDFDGALACW